MRESTVRGPFGTLRFTQDVEWVHTDLPQPDPNWRYTDQQGHEHYRDNEREVWPTLQWVVDETWWCEDCRDEHSDGHWACAICGEEIKPRLVPPPPGGTPIVTAQQYFLNDEPISPERAQELIASMIPPPPPTAMDRATMRAMAHWNMDRAGARHMVERTFVGQKMLLHEQLQDLRRAVATQYPRLTKLVAHHPLVAGIRWIWRQTQRL